MRFEELTLRQIEEWPVAHTLTESGFVGFAERGDDGRLLSIGIVYPIDATRFRVHFARREGSSPLVHQKMLKIARVLREAKVSEVLANCDDTIPNARKWLERGGFVPDADGLEWRLKLGTA